MISLTCVNFPGWSTVLLITFLGTWDLQLMPENKVPVDARSILSLEEFASVRD